MRAEPLAEGTTYANWKIIKFIGAGRSFGGQLYLVGCPKCGAESKKDKLAMERTSLCRKCKPPRLSCYWGGR